MKISRSLLLAIACSTWLSSTALAVSSGGLFVEPMITYENGDTETNFPAPLSNSTGKVEGFGIGARLGVHILESVFIAADGRYSMPNFKDSSIDYKARATQYNLAPVVGVQMPGIGVRLWGAYVATGELNPEANGNNVDVKYTDATGYRVGAGFRVAMVSINAEYQELEYGKATIEDGGGIFFPPGTSFDNVKLKNKSWLVSVSFPLEL